MRPLRTFPVLLLAAACSHASASTPQAAAPSLTPTPLPTCSTPAGFTLDTAHSVQTLTPGTYSTAEDVQAALVYDKLVTGQRTVFTRLKAPAKGDQVVQCNVLDFATTTDAARFVASFKDLRTQAGSLVTAVPVADGFGFREQGQSFKGYGIASTQVIEAASLQGSRFLTVSVAGPAPQVSTAQALLKELS